MGGTVPPPYPYQAGLPAIPCRGWRWKGQRACPGLYHPRAPIHRPRAPASRPALADFAALLPEPPPRPTGWNAIAGVIHLSKMEHLRQG